MIKIFVGMGHSGGSASVFIPTLNRLLSFENLKPLTDNPEEWNHVGDEDTGYKRSIWQSSRNPAAFSNDGGENYYFVNDPKRELHRSASYQEDSETTHE